MTIMAILLAILPPAALIIGFKGGVSFMRELNQEFNEDLERREQFTYTIR